VRADWVDRLRAADPGATRLLIAVQVVVTMLAAIAAEYVFVKVTGALQSNAPLTAAVAARNHGILVVALMLGAMVAMIAVFAAPMFDTVRQRALNLALIPVPVVGGLALGLTLAPYRIASFVAIVAVLTGGAYCRRFGPRGFFGGNLAFIGTFFGIFLHGLITISALGWLAAEVCLATVVAIAVQLLFLSSRDDRTLRRLRRSFGARSRGVAAVALEMVDLSAGRERERARLIKLLQRRLLRFNESALMVDAYLGRPGALPGVAGPGAVHQRIFDLELAVTNLARFAITLAATELPAGVRGPVRDGLVAIGELDPDRTRAAGEAMLGTLTVLTAGDESDSQGLADPRVRILAHRFAASLLGFAEALAALRAAEAGTEVAFEPAATLVGGFLPGSSTVSATASARLAPNVRVAVQMCVAVTVALILGDALDGRRYYWAVIAAFVTFMGAHNAGEQLRKGSLRVIGTVAGVLIGAVLAHLVGPHVGAALAVIMAALFLGMLLMRSSYAFFVVAMTIAVSQLYVELGEYSDSLLLLRLEETAVGAGAALLTVLLVAPLRTGRVVRVATSEYLTELTSLAETASARLLGTEDAAAVRAAARRLDVAYQALMAALSVRGVPLLPMPSSRVQFAAGLSASRNYARNLLGDAPCGAGFSSPRAEALTLATGTLASSIAEITSALERPGAERGIYVRAASLFDTLSVALDEPPTAPIQLALRDFELIDGSVAVVAAIAGLDVVSLDEAPAHPGRGPARR
jgi:hypothetical protein